MKTQQIKKVQLTPAVGTRQLIRKKKREKGNKSFTQKLWK